MDKFLSSTNDLLNHPVALLFLFSIFFMMSLKRFNLDVPQFIAAVNSISSQPFALLVLVIGFWMLVECKKYGIDTTIAGGVIGVASNMLQSQIKDASGNLIHQPGPAIPLQPPAGIPAVEVTPTPKS